MSGRTIAAQMAQGEFPASGRIHNIPGVGYMIAWGTTVPADAATGYAKSCMFFHTDAASSATLLYFNVGDLDSANFDLLTDVGLEAELALTTTGNGASKIGIEDSGSLITATTVEAAIAEVATHLTSAQKMISVPLMSLVEADTTALIAFGDGDSATPGFSVEGNGEFALRWNNHATPDPVAFSIPLPPDLNAGAAVVVHVLAKMSGTTDNPDLVTTAYFNAGDTDCAGADAEVNGGTTLTDYTNTIALADVPAPPGCLTVTFQPEDGAIGTDDLLVFGVWVEYTGSILTA